VVPYQQEAWEPAEKAFMCNHIAIVKSFGNVSWRVFSSVGILIETFTNTLSAGTRSDVYLGTTSRLLQGQKIDAPSLCELRRQGFEE
jgi:hypothetical protein